MHIILHSKCSWTGYGTALLLPILRQLASHSRRERQTQVCAFLEARKENREITPHTLEMNTILLPRRAASCCWCLGSLKTQRISGTNACSEPDKKVKAWANTANPWILWGNTNSFVPPQVSEPPVTALVDNSLGYVSQPCVLHSFPQMQTVGVTATWPQSTTLGLRSGVWADRSMAANLTASQGWEVIWPAPREHCGGVSHLLTRRNINY